MPAAALTVNDYSYLTINDYSCPKLEMPTAGLIRNDNSCPACNDHICHNWKCLQLPGL
jgi:hypothetical protein